MTNITYDTATPAAHAPERKSLFARIFDALVEARMQQAHREIARHIHLVPGGLTARAGFKDGRDDCAAKRRA